MAKKSGAPKPRTMKKVPGGVMKPGAMAPSEDEGAAAEIDAPDPSEGFLNPDAKKPEEKELTEDDYKEADDDIGDGSDKGVDEASARVEDSPAEKDIGDFLEFDLDENNAWVSVAFPSLTVRPEARYESALSGPGARTGGAIICLSCPLFPDNSDQFGQQEVCVLKRTHVVQMMRGFDYQFAYALLEATDKTDDDGKVETFM